jgi:hypothetical protein
VIDACDQCNGDDATGDTDGDGICDDLDPITGDAVTDFVLIDANSDVPVADHNPIADGATIDLALTGTDLNITALTDPYPVGSVAFELSGPVNLTRTENAPPYALFGDTGGDFAAGNLPVGSYTLTATPYSGKNGSGTEGIALTITFEVVSSVMNRGVVTGPHVRATTGSLGADQSVAIPTQRTATEIAMTLMPNPVRGTELVLEFAAPVAGDLLITILDPTGRRVYQQDWAGADEWSRIRLDLSGSQLSGGMYFLQLRTQTGEVITRRFVKVN